MSIEITSKKMILELLYSSEPVDGTNFRKDTSCTLIGSGGGLGNLQECILAMKASLFVREECDGSN
jgi:hypothetical protein